MSGSEIHVVLSRAFLPPAADLLICVQSAIPKYTESQNLCLTRASIWLIVLCNVLSCECGMMENTGAADFRDSIFISPKTSTTTLSTTAPDNVTNITIDKRSSTRNPAIVGWFMIWSSSRMTLHYWLLQETGHELNLPYYLRSLDTKRRLYTCMVHEVDDIPHKTHRWLRTYRRCIYIPVWWSLVRTF